MKIILQKCHSPRSGDDNEEVVSHLFREVQHLRRETLAGGVQGIIVTGLCDQLTLKWDGIQEKEPRS